MSRQTDKSTGMECFTPENDNPYPLCVGNGSDGCKECAQWVHLQPDYEWEYQRHEK